MKSVPKCTIREETETIFLVIRSEELKISSTMFLINEWCKNRRKLNVKYTYPTYQPYWYNSDKILNLIPNFWWNSRNNIPMISFIRIPSKISNCRNGEFKKLKDASSYEKIFAASYTTSYKTNLRITEEYFRSFAMNRERTTVGII